MVIREEAGLRRKGSKSPADADQLPLELLLLNPMTEGARGV